MNKRLILLLCLLALIAFNASAKSFTDERGFTWYYDQNPPTWVERKIHYHEFTIISSLFIPTRVKRFLIDNYGGCWRITTDDYGTHCMVWMLDDYGYFCGMYITR